MILEIKQVNIQTDILKNMFSEYESEHKDISMRQL